MAWYRVQRGAEPPELDAQSAHHDTLICVHMDDRDELLGFAEGVCDTCGLPRIPASVVKQYEVRCNHRDAEEVEVCYLLGGLCVAGDTAGDVQGYLEQIGRPSGDGFYVVALEGELIGDVWDGMIVRPSKVLWVIPAPQAIRKIIQEEAAK